MPSTIPRTYGKKPQTKRKTSPNDGENGDPKRRKLTQSQPGVSTNVGDSLPQLSAKGSSGTYAKLHSPPSTTISPAKSTNHAASATPTKLTKRMLGRSKTESSIESMSSATTMASRTISMPVIPSSPSQSISKEGQSHEHRPLITTSVSTTRVKRTYAGQSRSFLISLPVGDFNPDATQGIESQEDELFERESYSSLRARWGVDYTEDDPMVPPGSPSRSKSNSNNSTPSRKGKGKGKGKAPAVYLPPNMMNPLKSITELRSKGESRRFMDEVGYLFEGMDPSNSAGLKRSSASEITTKLCDEEFTRKAKAADFYHKTWDVFLKAGAGRGEDKILDVLLVFLVALIARNLDTLLELARQDISDNSAYTSEAESSITRNGKGKDTPPHPDTLVGILFFILKSSADTDPLAMASPSHSTTDFEFKQIGLSKKDKTMLSNLYTTISNKSRLFPEGTPISTPLLTSHILRNLPSSLIPPAHISDLLYSFRTLLDTSFPTDNPFDGSCPDDLEIEPQYECIRNHLHLLDMYLLGQWRPPSPSFHDDEDGLTRRQILEEVNATRDRWLIDGLIAVAVCAEMKLQEDNGAELVFECLEILLRVLVNLTHGDETWSRKVINNDFAVTFIIRLLAVSALQPSHLGDEKMPDIKPKVEDEENGRETTTTRKRSASTRALDKLCLGLGLLTNLVQSVPEFKNTLRRTKASPTCTLKDTSCIRQCKCPDSINTLQILVKVYEKQSPTSPVHDDTTTTKTKSEIKSEPEPSPPPPPPPTSDLQALTIAEADASLVQGTLAILFGLLMQDSPSNQAVILSAMSSRSGGGNRAKLGKLVEQAKEFVTIYNAMSSGRGGGEREKDVEERSASEVVGVLEQLRDECWMFS